jgi:hypothetical protein
MGKGALIGIVGVGILALIALAEGTSHAMPPPGVLPDSGPPKSWRRMLDSELVPSEVQYAVSMLNHSGDNEEIHLTSAGWRRWLREGGNVTVWRPSSDPYPGSGGGGLPSSNQGQGDQKS